MHYLSPHGESEQYHPVEKEYWPKYRHIKYTEECHYKSNAEGFCDRVPELELREAAHERPEFVRSPSRKRGSVNEFLDLRVDLRREKADEEVEDVDAEAVGDDVETLDEVDADDVDEGDGEKSDPTVEDVWSRLVEEVLVLARDVVGPPRDGCDRRRRREIFDTDTTGRCGLHMGPYFVVIGGGGGAEEDGFSILKTDGWCGEGA